MSWWNPWIGMSAGLLAAGAREPGPETRLDVSGQYPILVAQALRGYEWDELVTGWTACGSALVRARTAEEQLEQVNVRAAIVDELERRNPRAFRVWFTEEQRRQGLGR